MTLRTKYFLLAVALTVFIGGSALASESAADWPQFRGWRATGIADGQDLPESWDAETWSNIRWRAKIDGLGHASPIVTGAYIFIVTADNGATDPELRVGLYGDIASVKDDSSHKWQLVCLAKSNGRVLWIRNLHEGVPAIKRHTKATHANSTPATDGTHVVVFLGSEGLYCYDRYGNRLWEKQLGVLDSGYYQVPAAQWGFSSSPIIYQNKVIVQCDVQKDAFVAAFDVHDGRELWRTERNDVPGWSTPSIYEGAKRTELVLNGYEHAGGYDPDTGAELWRLGDGGDIPVPTPISAHGLIYLGSAHGPRSPLSAIRPGAAGDVTPNKDGENDHLAWRHPRAGIYMQTPIVYGDFLYACRDNGVLTCFNARTGERIYRQRIGQGRSGFTASPVASDGKLYFTSENGTIYVVRAGPVYELLAENDMNDVCMATPAISEGLLLVRTKKYLYGVGSPFDVDTPLAQVDDDADRRTAAPAVITSQFSPVKRCYCRTGPRRPFYFRGFTFPPAIDYHRDHQPSPTRSQSCPRSSSF